MMCETKKVFFCAVGGSGMLPLAMVMKSLGYDVSGSDRSYDQRRLPERFAFIQKSGITLFPQDGSGITNEVDQLVVSTAVEETVPDYVAAKAKNIPIRHRADVLAELLGKAKTSLAIAGTSGKSTTTGMIGWILEQTGYNPTIINGAVMKNFIREDNPIASSLVGDPDLFVAEVDESDGSIAKYTPTIAILNNVAFDHKTMDELRALFRDFIGKAKQVVINLDNEETAKLAAELKKSAITYGFNRPEAILSAGNVTYYKDGVGFDLRHNPSLETRNIRLLVPGDHNISNAMAAIGASLAMGVPFIDAAKAIECFTGINRRMEVIGSAKDITIIDDFAHNPDKIKASLKALHQFEGRLLILFQPHGYGPVRLMRTELAECFSQCLSKKDQLFMCDPLYLGGTTNKSVGSAELCQDITALGGKATHLAARTDCTKAILALASADDRIIIMGARDDSLPLLAREMLAQIENKG